MAALSAQLPPSPHGGGRSPAAAIDSTATHPPTPAGDGASFCENKLATTEPSQYYSLLFVAGDRRAALVPAYAFWLEVREVVDECREAEIARVKLGWWHEEIHETAAGRPRHPVSVALSPILKAHPRSVPTLLAVIEALGRHAEGASYATYAELRDYGVKTRGAVEQMAASITGAADATTMESAADLGALVELAGLLRDTGLHARRARCYLPLEDLARFRIDPRDLYAGRTSDAMDELIKFEARRLGAALREQTARVPTAARPSLASLLAAADISNALLEKIAAAGGRVLRERPTLMPLRQLWIAWRSARRSGHATR